jgi:hypothetical protein
MASFLRPAEKLSPRWHLFDPEMWEGVEKGDGERVPIQIAGAQTDHATFEISLVIPVREQKLLPGSDCGLQGNEPAHRIYEQQFCAFVEWFAVNRMAIDENRQTHTRSFAAAPIVEAWSLCWRTPRVLLARFKIF